MAGQVPDIPGVKAPPHGAREVLGYIGHLLNRRSNNFPGAQPVSFARRHLTKELLEHDYFVCEKSDGLRCLLLLRAEDDEEKAYMVTRKCEVFFVPDLHVPLTVEDESSFHGEGTLIDGELVRTSSGKLVFLMFDILVCNGKVVTNRNLDTRLGYIHASVFKPFRELCRAYPEATNQFPFTLRMKKMEFSYGVAKVLEEKLDHVSDGLIFTSRTAPYMYGTDPNILKWKPANENSVDYVLKLEFSLFTDTNGEQWYDYDSKPQAQLLTWYGGNDDRQYAKMHIEDDEWTTLKERNEPLNDRVVECYMDDKKRWRFLRFRDDKEHGNHIDVVTSVLESITDGVTEQDLVDNYQQIRAAWHEREQENKKRKREHS